MRKAQALLLKLLEEKGSVNKDIVKVDRFLNHLADIELIKEIGRDIAEYYKDKKIDKIVTVEASGIVPAQAAAFFMDIDFVYAKKKKPLTMDGYFKAASFSFTKQEQTELFISKEVIRPGERLLFVDDFYAKGNTLRAMEALAHEAGAVLAGKAVVIDKQGAEEIYSILTLCEIKKVFGII